MTVVDLLAVISFAITVFSAGVAVGKIISDHKLSNKFFIKEKNAMTKMMKKTLLTVCTLLFVLVAASAVTQNVHAQAFGGPSVPATEYKWYYGNKEKVNAAAGTTYMLQVGTLKAKNCKWSSSNKNVAEIYCSSLSYDKTNFTATVLFKKPGKANIKVKIGKKTYTFACKVTGKAAAAAKKVYYPGTKCPAFHFCNDDFDYKLEKEGGETNYIYTDQIGTELVAIYRKCLTTNKAKLLYKDKIDGYDLWCYKEPSGKCVILIHDALNYEFAVSISKF